jgi:hypothetical protein
MIGYLIIDISIVPISQIGTFREINTKTPKKIEPQNEGKTNRNRAIN